QRAEAQPARAGEQAGQQAARDVAALAADAGDHDQGDEDGWDDERGHGHADEQVDVREAPEHRPTIPDAAGALTLLRWSGWSSRSAVRWRSRPGSCPSARRRARSRRRSAPTI